MSMTLQERSLFLQRTSVLYAGHQKWAHTLGKVVTYRLPDFRAWIEQRLHENRCCYCRGPLTLASFVLDHKVPIVRHGRFTLKNLEVCCPTCHAAKGILDACEFKDMLAVVRTWPKPVMGNFLARLEAGTRVIPPQLPREGSPEWFLGPETTSRFVEDSTSGHHPPRFLPFPDEGETP